MNVQVNVYIAFSGHASELEPLISDITDAVIKNGYGVDPSQDFLTSLVVARLTEVGEYENTTDFAKNVCKGSISVVIPVKEEENGSRDQGEASSES